MIKLTSTDECTRIGVGLTKFCYVPLDVSLEKGMSLKIDGTLYRLRGIEIIRKLLHPPIIDRNMGLVVTPIPPIPSPGEVSGT